MNFFLTRAANNSLDCKACRNHREQFAHDLRSPAGWLWKSQHARKINLDCFLMLNPIIPLLLILSTFKTYGTVINEKYEVGITQNYIEVI